jgi:hypothetical protein
MANRRGNIMRRKSFVFLCGLAAVACGRDGIDGPGSISVPGSGVGSLRLMSIASCPTYPGVAGLLRACMFDGNGKTYAVDDDLDVLPAAPPYGGMFVFQAGYVPLEADVTRGGAEAPVKVYAAPYDVHSQTQCCAEDSPTNQIPAQTVLDSGHAALIISVPDAVPAGDQVAITLGFDSLYRSRLAPPSGGACDLPSADVCTYIDRTSFYMRFYVGSGPAWLAPADPAAVPDGACLLSYNTALVSGDDCCYRKGAANTCDTGIKCNDRSGAGCCLIYGTENTSHGQRCCLYANGGNVDGAEECDQLLAAQ